MTDAPPLWSCRSTQWPRRWQEKRAEIVARHMIEAEREVLEWVRADYAKLAEQEAALKALLGKDCA